MSKKSFFIICCLAILLSLGTIFYFLKTKKGTLTVTPNESKATAEEASKKENAKASPDTQSFFVAGWLPYWEKEKGIDSIREELSLFSEINPFAVKVNSDGSINDDALRLAASPWPEFQETAKNENVAFSPTILWADAKSMHDVFSNADLLNKHVDFIAAFLEKNNFPGVDIDYEGKDIADRDLFTSFLELLHEKLGSEGKVLSCTVEARTEDSPPAGWSGTRAMAFANDYSALNKFCDRVRVMAYDESFQVHGAKESFDDSNKNPSAPNADNNWTEEVIRYALRFISPEKLVLGVPTYGWEFQIEKLSSGYRYTRVGSISYPAAIEEAKKAKVTPVRSNGGELTFIYDTYRGQHIVTFSDAEAVRQKIAMAKSFHLKGISIFKIDGFGDPGIYSMLERVLGK